MKEKIGFNEAIITILVAIIVVLLITFPLMWLWNWLIPTIFNGPIITFWETLGLYILVHCFTGIDIINDNK